MKEVSKIGIEKIVLEDLEEVKCDLYFYIDNSGKKEAEEYLDNLQEKDFSKFYTVFEYMIQFGKVTNEEKFKPLENCDKIFEFKIHGHRILCFILEGLNPKSFILTHGFKKQKTPKREISKAEVIKDVLHELFKKKELNRKWAD